MSQPPPQVQNSKPERKIGRLYDRSATLIVLISYLPLILIVPSNSKLDPLVTRYNTVRDTRGRKNPSVSPSLPPSPSFFFPREKKGRPSPPPLFLPIVPDASKKKTSSNLSGTGFRAAPSSRVIRIGFEFPCHAALVHSKYGVPSRIAATPVSRTHGVSGPSF